MINQVQVLGANKFLTIISKALVMSNIISVVSFLGIGAIVMLQVKKKSKPAEEDLKKNI